MIGSILSSVGGSLGKYFGGGTLSTIGRYTGRLAGDYLEKNGLKEIKQLIDSQTSMIVSISQWPNMATLFL